MKTFFILIIIGFALMIGTDMFFEGLTYLQYETLWYTGLLLAIISTKK